MNKDCNLCSLRKHSNQPVFGRGNKRAKILIVGEAPGEQESIAGIPFVGKAGQLLDEILHKADIQESDIYVFNVVCCRPPQNDIKHKDALEAIKICPKAHLLPLISAIRPEVILALGNTPHKFFFGSEGIVKKRGTVKTWNGIKIVPSLHPSFLRRGNMQYLSDVISDFKLAKSLINIKSTTQKILLKTEEEVSNLCNKLRESKRISCDVETSGLNVYAGDEIIGIGFSYNRDSGYYIQIRDKSVLGDNLEICVSDKILSDIKGVLEDEKVGKTFHKAMFDVEFLKQDLGIIVRSVRADSLVLAHILDENTPNDLEYLTNSNYPDLVGYKDESNLLMGRGRIKRFDKLPIEVIKNRCCNDTIATFRLTEDFTKTLRKDPQLFEYYKRFHLEVQPVLMKIQERGFKIDLEYAEECRLKYERALSILSGKIYKIVGREFNINSGPELVSVFEQFNFPILKTTEKSGTPSTDIGALSLLKDATHHPILDLLLAYSAVEKVYSTYILGLPKVAIGGIVHGRLHTTTTVTDRLSATEPNQQNIVNNKHIKKMICAREGFTFVYADYCLDGDTEINLLSGADTLKNIERRISEGEEIYTLCFNLEKRRTGVERIERAWLSTKNAPVFEIMMDNGESFKGTKEHQILMRDGTYKKIEDLHIGDSLLPSHRVDYNTTYGKKYTNVSSISRLNRVLNIPLHRIVVEDVLGIDRKGKVIHHIDRDGTNNNLSNLEVLTPNQHEAIHGKEHTLSDKVRENFSNPKYRKKLSTAIKKSWGECSDENRQFRISQMIKAVRESGCNVGANNGMFGKHHSPESILKIKNRRTLMSKEITCVICGKSRVVAGKEYNKLKYNVCGRNCSNILRGMRDTNRVSEDFGKITDKVTDRIDNNHKVVGIRFYGYKDVYNMTVSNCHNYALKCGIFAKNCQAEIRGFAFLSGEEALMKACTTADIYITMAKVMFKKDNITKESPERQFTKGMVLGILYGMGEESLSGHLKTSKVEASKIHTMFFRTFPKVKNFVDSTIEFVHKNGYVRNVFGGMRRFPKINNDTEYNIAEYERQAVNYIIQSSTANFVKRALIKVNKEFDTFNGGIVITVHDSILCEVADSQLERFAPIFVNRLLEPEGAFSPPMKVDLKIGKSWWDLKKYTI